MNEKLGKIRSGLGQLHLIFERPRIYLHNYFANLKHEVDITCQLYINSQSIEQKKFNSQSERFKLYANNIKLALDHQILLIEKIANFEQECYDGLSSDDKLELTVQIPKILQSVEYKINDPLWAEENACKIDELLYRMLSRLHKLIFLNSTIFFLTKEELSRLKIASFGMLVLICGEFFDTRVIGKIK